MISIYLDSIKFFISAWIQLARNAFEDVALLKSHNEAVKINGYPVICKREGMMPQKSKESI